MKNTRHLNILTLNLYRDEIKQRKKSKDLGPLLHNESKMELDFENHLLADCMVKGE